MTASGSARLRLVENDDLHPLDNALAYEFGREVSVHLEAEAAARQRGKDRVQRA